MNEEQQVMLPLWIHVAVALLMMIDYCDHMTHISAVSPSCHCCSDRLSLTQKIL